MNPAIKEEPEAEPSPPPVPMRTPAPRVPPPLPRPKPRKLAPQPIPGQSLSGLQMEEQPEPEEPAPAKRSSLRLVLLLLLLLAGLAVCALLSLLFIPTVRERIESLPIFGQSEQTIVEPAVAGNTSPAAIATDVVTTIMATPELATTVATAVATAVSVEANGLATATPFPTITPLAEAASPTPIIGIIIVPPEVAGTPGTGETTINVLQNGDFSDDWANGWSLETSDLNGSQIIERVPPGFDAPGEVLSMGKTGSGSVQLTQRAVLNDRTAKAVFRARLRQSGTVHESTGREGRSALLLIYESADGTPQGASVWFDGAADQTGLWSEPPLSELGPNLMARYATNNDWQEIELSLEQEFLENLPDIDPADVRQITVMLLLIANEDCPAESCMATLEAADLQLMMPFP